MYEEDKKYYLEQTKGLHKWLKIDTAWTGFVFTKSFVGKALLGCVIDSVEIGFGVFGIMMAFVILYYLNDFDKKLIKLDKGEVK